MVNALNTYLSLARSEGEETGQQSSGSRAKCSAGLTHHTQVSRGDIVIKGISELTQTELILGLGF